jgi:uridine kinase
MQDIPIGSLLVHSECKNGEPLLLHVMLPACIRDRNLAEQAYVFLLDAQVQYPLSEYVPLGAY